jgi:peptidyl-prolyl cis-trans isomerase A (cyclophilin A)
VKHWLFSIGLLVLLLTVLPGHAGTLAQFRTTIGDFDVELYDAEKPVTVKNFIRYVQEGLYTDMFMHRVVTNFVIQGGGIFVGDRGTTNAALYYIPTFSPITNEFGVGKFYSNTYGTIAMAKTSDPNSATSQFFFNLTNNAAALDNTNNSGGFTVFGRVVSGTNILNRFKLGPTNQVIKKLNLGGVLSELPVLYAADPAYVSYDDLVYVDISLLQVAVNPVTDGGKEISWNSAAGLTNIVEFTAGFPPAWNTLALTNGTGTRMAVVDAAATPRRFYRVRVAY